MKELRAYHRERNEVTAENPLNELDELAKHRATDVGRTRAVSPRTAGSPCRPPNASRVRREVPPRNIVRRCPR
jgi:hypothetical protein